MPAFKGLVCPPQAVKQITSMQSYEVSPLSGLNANMMSWQMSRTEEMIELFVNATALFPGVILVSHRGKIITAQVEIGREEVRRKEEEKIREEKRRDDNRKEENKREDNRK